MNDWLVQYGLTEYQHFFAQERLDSLELLCILTDEERADCWRKGQIRLGHVLKLNRLLNHQLRHIYLVWFRENQASIANNRLRLRVLLERHELSTYADHTLGSGYDEKLLKDLTPEEIKLTISHLNIQLYGHVARFRRMLEEIRRPDSVLSNPAASSAYVRSINDAAGVNGAHVDLEEEAKNGHDRRCQLSSELVDLLKLRGLLLQQHAFIQAGITSVDVIREIGAEDCKNRLNLKVGPRAKLRLLLDCIFADQLQSKPLLQSQPVPATIEQVQRSTLFRSSGISPQASLSQHTHSQLHSRTSQTPLPQSIQTSPQQLSENSLQEEDSDCTLEEFHEMCDSESTEILTRLRNILARHPEWSMTPNKQGIHPLFLSSVAEISEALIEAKADPNTRSHNQTTPLMELIEFTTLKEDRDDAFYCHIALLMSLKADPNVSIKTGGSLLESAMAHHDLATVNLLLQNGAQITPDILAKFEESFLEGFAALKKFSR